MHMCACVCVCLCGALCLPPCATHRLRPRHTRCPSGCCRASSFFFFSYCLVFSVVCEWVSQRCRRGSCVVCVCVHFGGVGERDNGGVWMFAFWVGAVNGRWMNHGFFFCFSFWCCAWKKTDPFLSLLNAFFFFNSDYLFKLLLIGDSGVGKSCLLLRFAVSVFFWGGVFSGMDILDARVMYERGHMHIMKWWRRRKNGNEFENRGMAREGTHADDVISEERRQEDVQLRFRSTLTWGFSSY